jgi:DNA-binding CsgD family transcriptional regulator/PAS domain-containing protein
MDEAQDVSRLIGGVYDAALTPSTWPQVLGEIAAFMDGTISAIFTRDPASMTGMISYDSGADPAVKKSYFDTYIRLDPTTTSQFFVDVDELVSTEDIMPYDEFLQTRYYLEWVKPQGLADALGSVIDRNFSKAALFNVFFSERHGIVNKEDRRKASLIVPHVRRSVLIGRLIDLKATETVSLSNVLDQLRTAIIMVDRTGFVTHANAAGYALMGEGSPVSCEKSRFKIIDPAVQKYFVDLFEAAHRGDAGVGQQGIAVPLTDKDGAHYVAHVLPLISGARGAEGRAYQAVASVFIHKAKFDPPSPPEVIAKAYKLTPSELRTMLAIVEIGGVPEAAVAMGIAESTVKSHLSRLFEKTGATRQADLVKIFAGYANPPVGSELLPTAK